MKKIVCLIGLCLFMNISCASIGEGGDGGAAFFSFLTSAVEVGTEVYDAVDAAGAFDEQETTTYSSGGSSTSSYSSSSDYSGEGDGVSTSSRSYSYSGGTDNYSPPATRSASTRSTQVSSSTTVSPSPTKKMSSNVKIDGGVMFESTTNNSHIIKYYDGTFESLQDLGNDRVRRSSGKWSFVTKKESNGMHNGMMICSDNGLNLKYYVIDSDTIRSGTIGEIFKRVSSQPNKSF